MEHITLFFRQGSSGIIYQVSILPKDGGYVVQFQYGRRGRALQSGQKNPVPVSYDMRLSNKPRPELSPLGPTL